MNNLDVIDPAIVIQMNERTMLIVIDEVEALFLFTRDKEYKLGDKEIITPWGYATYAVTNVKLSEKDELFELYFNDIKNNNFWWENK